MSYRAFVSSTYQDLKDHRAYVIKELRKAGISVDPMEDWTAATGEPKEFSQKRVKGCNLCVLLVARRRGHIPEGETRSIMQLEYEAAIREGMDVLVYLLDDKAPWWSEFDERDSDPELLRWRKQLQEKHGRGLFGLAPVSIEIAPALTRWVDAKGKEGKQVGGPKKIWHVLHPRNLNFTGRDELLTQLRKDLTSGQTSAVTQAIAGLGGIGKTQLALEYAYCHADDYNVVWWVRAEEPTTLLEDLAALSHAQARPEAASPDLAAAAAAARRSLESKRNWLLIFDNASEPAALQDALPRTSSGHVLITSRNPNWRTVAKQLEVPTLDREASVDLLVKLSGDTDRAAAAALAEELGDLPLALEQAGAFIEASGGTIADYLALYRQKGKELRARRAESPQYPRSVATTYEISIQSLAEEAPEAVELLNLLAFAAPEAFPLSVLTNAGEALPPELQGLADDAIARADARSAIRKLSLAQVVGDSISMHRVVQAVVRDRLSAERGHEISAGLVEVWSAVFPFDQNDPETWSGSVELLPHVLQATEHAVALNVQSESVGGLLNRAGTYLWMRAEFAQARAAYERALRIDETVYGPEHPEVARDVNNLGSVLQDLGDHAGAKAAFERALRIDERFLGPDHPNTRIVRGNLEALG